MKKILASLVLAVIILSCDKNDDDDNGNGLNSTDRGFVLKAASSNEAEISLGQLGQLNATDPGVVYFAQLMVNEHIAAKASLNTVASGVGLSTPDTLDAVHIALRNRLDTLSGFIFDSVYIRTQVLDHQGIISSYENELIGGANSALRNYADDMLPILRRHLEIADSIAQDFQ